MNNGQYRGRHHVANGHPLSDPFAHPGRGDVDRRDLDGANATGSVRFPCAADPGPRPRNHRQLREIEDGLRLLPAPEPPCQVTAQDQRQRPTGVIGPQSSQCVNGVRHASALQLQVTQLESRVMRDCRFDETPPNRPRRDGFSGLVGRNRRGDPEQAPQRQRIGHLAGDDRVTQMWWVEGSAENADPVRRIPAGTRRTPAASPRLAFGTHHERLVAGWGPAPNRRQGVSRRRDIESPGFAGVRERFQ